MFKDEIKYRNLSVERTSVCKTGVQTVTNLYNTSV